MIDYDKDEIRKIILLRNDKIGDMIVSSNVFRELRKSFPKAKITVVASKSNRPLIEKSKSVDEIIELEYDLESFRGIMNYLKAMRKIKRERYDLGVDLRGSFINVFSLFYLGKVKHKIGFFNRKASKKFLDYAYEKDRKNMHSTVHRIDLINKALGLKAENYWPEIATDKEDEANLKKMISKHKLKKYVVISPDASLEKKQWGLEKFDSVIKFIKENYPEHRILLVGSNKEKLNYLATKNPECISILNKNLRLVYLLMGSSDLVVAQDGGPMHLAWASKAKLVALMTGYLGIKYVGPLGKKSKTLVSDKDNMNSIKVNEVTEKIDELLKK